MTFKQKDLYIKLRNKLIYRGIETKYLPTIKKLETIDNQKIYMIIKVFSEEIKNLDAWEYSYSFRESCFIKYGCDFSIYNKIKEEIQNVLEYAGL